VATALPIPPAPPSNNKFLLTCSLPSCPDKLNFQLNSKPTHHANQVHRMTIVV
jgi:hypothetical protein